MAETSGTTNADSTSTGATVTKASTGHPAPVASSQIAGGGPFNGTNTDYETSANAAFAITGDKTVQAWVNATTFNDDTGGNSRHFIFKNIDGTNAYMLSCNQSGLGFYFVNDDSGGEHVKGIASTTGSWHDVVGTSTSSGSVVNIYVDGLGRDDESFSLSRTKPSQRFSIP